MLSARPVGYPLDPDRAFQPDIAGLDALVTERTRAIIVNSPSNPLGSTFDARDTGRHPRLRPPARPLGHLRRGLRAVHVGRAAREHRVARRGRPRVQRLLPLEDVRDDRRQGRLARDAAGLPRHDAARAGVRDQLRQHPRPVRGGRGADRFAAAGGGCRRRTTARTSPRPPTCSTRAASAISPPRARSISGSTSATRPAATSGPGRSASSTSRASPSRPGTAFGAGGEGWIRVCLASDAAELLAGLGRLPAP